MYQDDRLSRTFGGTKYQNNIGHRDLGGVKAHAHNGQRCGQSNDINEWSQWNVGAANEGLKHRNSSQYPLLEGWGLSGRSPFSRMSGTHWSNGQKEQRSSHYNSLVWSMAASAVLASLRPCQVVHGDTECDDVHAYRAMSVFSRRRRH